LEKSESNLRLGLILLLIAAVAGLLLGGAYKLTKEPIAQQTIKKNNEAMQAVLPSADSFVLKEVDLPEGSLVSEVNEGKKLDEVQGYAMKVTNDGYGGKISIMVGISIDGQLQGLTILEHSETPGLGANATLPDFRDQFKDKPVEDLLEVVKTPVSKDNEIQALTGATITSKAVTNAVNSAIELFNNSLKGGN
jgi:electron transport complex protein RnfG